VRRRASAGAMRIFHFEASLQSPMVAPPGEPRSLDGDETRPRRTHEKSTIPRVSPGLAGDAFSWEWARTSGLGKKIFVPALRPFAEGKSRARIGRVR